MLKVIFVGFLSLLALFGIPFLCLFIKEYLFAVEPVSFMIEYSLYMVLTALFMVIIGCVAYDVWHKTKRQQ